MSTSSPQDKSQNELPVELTQHLTQSAPLQAKRRRWLWIVAAIVVLGVLVAFNMYRESLALERMNKRMPGLEEAKSAPAPQRYTNPNLGYSIILPLNWQPVEQPGKPIVFIGDSIMGSTPNLQIKEFPYTGELEACAEFNVSGMRLMFKDYKEVEQCDIVTDAGLKGKRYIIEHMMSGKKFRQIHYFIKKSDKLYLIACASLQAVAGTELDTVFDKCIKSVQLVP
jgi:hypothetical protein